MSEIAFTATKRSILGSRALYTTPIATRPVSDTISYRPKRLPQRVSIATRSVGIQNENVFPALVYRTIPYLNVGTSINRITPVTHGRSARARFRCSPLSVGKTADVRQIAREQMLIGCCGQRGPLCSDPLDQRCGQNSTVRFGSNALPIGQNEVDEACQDSRTFFVGRNQWQIDVAEATQGIGVGTRSIRQRDLQVICSRVEDCCRRLLHGLR